MRMRTDLSLQHLGHDVGVHVLHHLRSLQPSPCTYVNLSVLILASYGNGCGSSAFLKLGGAHYCNFSLQNLCVAPRNVHVALDAVLTRLRSSVL
jgi:hypothetical protein